MMRMTLGAAGLAALLGTYWMNPTAAWVALGVTFTFALARHIRQRDDLAERTLRSLDD